MNTGEIKDAIEAAELEEQQTTSEIEALEKRRKATRRRLHELRAEYKRRTADIDVTDHAVVRYLERIMDLDADKYREMLVEELTRKEAARMSQEVKVPLKGGGRALIRNCKIITIYE
jgi:septal ring factor EnvC (AmiA/AmiB activator)